MHSKLVSSELEFLTPDEFQFGALITNEKRIIIYANEYFSDELSWNLDSLIGKNSEDLFTHSSKIFYESYLMPLLLHEKKCEEIQLTMLDGKSKRLPIIVNARMDERGYIYWSFFNASKRDKLYEELLDTRTKLEQQAKILQSKSSTDELTGLMNRREMNLRAPELINQAKRYSHTIALLMIDIDHFKNINDSYGHLEGDRILEELGHWLQTFGRETDLIARFGGEEFIMLLPDTGIEEANLFAERLHKLVSQVEIANSPITVSIGITLSDGNKTLHELTRQADIALYQAKESGRNTTQFFEKVRDVLKPIC
ncbi:sensor domain-containing diguanylate cyclase [Paraglaciecola arctica]|uniref:sensor domain-containing diguanylate cyclase n=1 Tax=Paraglaciecola arctica TaxID=1128911 RepID=UPI001C0787B5|nr:diguanylate cyclase [Paraglaciecola arctica]MBU3004574.1 diguanylate cyclase [Paraglaciecola arctica]